MSGFFPWFIIMLKLVFTYAVHKHGLKSSTDSEETNYVTNFEKSTPRGEMMSWSTPIPRLHNKKRTLPPRPINNRYPSTRWGPYFDEGSEPTNITARIGSTVRLNCKISLLHDKTVTWVHKKGDTIHLLTVAHQPYSTDQRIMLSFRYPNNWRLEITSVTHRDDGIYECQVATHPPTVKSIYLQVTAPEVKIVDEKGYEIKERYYKAGSQVELPCHGSQIQFSIDEITWWKSKNLLEKGITLNASNLTGTAVSTLTIPQAQKIHSGNYTCAVGHLASASVSVHILNAELPAAVHDGSANPIMPGFITTWLLTLSCVIGSEYVLSR